MTWPVTKAASSEARKATTPAVSAGSPIRPRANEAPASARCAAVNCANDQHRSADLVFVPVSDLSPSEVVAAWPDTSRSRAVAGFVRTAVEVAASHPEPTTAFA